MALHLTRLSQSVGASAVERIPVLGRTGPDLTTNELGLVVDVKSRLEVPKGYFADRPALYGRHLAIPLDRLLLLLDEPAFPWRGCPSVLVERWLAHMDEWRAAHAPAGISALVLHRPKKPIGQSMLVIYQSSVEELKCRLKTLSSRMPPPTTWPSPNP